MTGGGALMGPGAAGLMIAGGGACGGTTGCADGGGVLVPPGPFNCFIKYATARLVFSYKIVYKFDLETNQALYWRARGKTRRLRRG